MRHDPVLRAFAGAQMLLAALWGIFGATWFLFALEELGPEPGARRASWPGVGGASSFIGAVVAPRARRTRWGIGPVAIAAMLLAALGNRSSRSRRPGCRSSPSLCLVAQQLVADSAVTVYDVTEVSVRQTLVHDRELGRVDVHVPRAGGRRPAGRDARRRACSPRSSGCGRRRSWRRSAACSAAAILWWSPVRRLRELPTQDGRTPAEVVVEVERDQPVGA